MEIRQISQTHHFDATLALPGSKSITNRALLLAALSDGPSIISDPLRSDDSEAFVECLNAMGAEVSWVDNNVVISKPLPSDRTAEVFCRDAGTAARFLPAAAGALSSTITFDATEQMRRRPMSPLLDALRAQGATTDPIDATHIPFTISSHGLSGGDVEIGGDISSQFLSGLLMAAPLALAPTTFHVADLISKPYIDLTISMMEQFGRTVERDGYSQFRIANNGRYIARDTPYVVEADASTASYFFAAAAATHSTICVTNINKTSPQGDIRLLDILEEMGAAVTDTPEGIVVTGPEQLHGVDVDMNDISDVMMTLACIAPLADSPTTIRNVAHARLKESDRIAAVVSGLTRLGITTEDGPDWITIYPGQAQAASVDTFDDHRIAMSFSVLGLATGDVGIENPDCVKKTCPNFFELVEKLQ